MPHYDVFLSHNSADRPAVETLARRLADEAGLLPFLDSWHLIPGEPWQEALEESLDQSRTCAIFIGPIGIGPWENEEMRAAIEQRVADRSLRVIPVLLPGAERGKRGRLPAFLSRTTWVEFRQSLDDAEAFRRLVAGIKGQAPGRGAGEVVYQGVCPYRGLQVFEEEHASFFFGREATTEWLVNELRPSTDSGSGNRFLAIIGPSGSGKSSLVRAGLVPALRRGDLPGSSTWPLHIFKPGPYPLESLAVAVTQLVGPTDQLATPLRLKDALTSDQRQLHLVTRIALADAPVDRSVVLIVDQFEEIFTLCRDERQRTAFIDNLLYVSAVKDGRVMVILTMRVDFYGKCAVYPDLAARITDHQMLIGSMMEEELRRAIEQPAHLVGLEFERGLVETLLHDVQAEPGALPLLQHALLELWERREGHRLTFAAYREIGGIWEAISHRAEIIYASFDPVRQALIRRIMLRLTQPGEGTEDTSRRATLTELLPVESDAASVEAVVYGLADARLLTTGKGELGDEVVDLASQTLIWNWPRLRAWIEEDRVALHTLRRLAEAASEWEENNRDESYLYRGTRLARAEELAEVHGADLNLLEQKFLKASLTLRELEAVEREAQRQRELEAAKWGAQQLHKQGATRWYAQTLEARYQHELGILEQAFLQASTSARYGIPPRYLGGCLAWFLTVLGQIVLTLMTVSHKLFNPEEKPFIASDVEPEIIPKAHLTLTFSARRLTWEEKTYVPIQVSNRGDGPVENVCVRILEADGYSLRHSNPEQQIDYLSPGESRQLKFYVEPKANSTTIQMKVIYNDDGNEMDLDFNGLIEFLRFREFQPVDPVPYIVGPPIDPEAGTPFVGRQDLIDWIEQNLQERQRPTLVLYGQRRTGKTSVLRQVEKGSRGKRLREWLHHPVYPVYIDLQKFTDPGTDIFLIHIAETIATTLQERKLICPDPGETGFLQAPYRAFNQFLDLVESNIKGGLLLLMLDEFEELEQRVANNKLDKDIFNQFRSQMQHRSSIVFILAGTHRLEEMSRDYQSIVFNAARHKEVTFLDHSDAISLIQDPVYPIVTYDSEAVDKIWLTCRGHPYLTQLLCSEIIHEMNRLGESNTVTLANIDQAIERIINKGGQELSYLWDESTPVEQVILAAMAGFINIDRTWLTYSEIFVPLKSAVLSKANLTKALEKLVIRRVLEMTSSQSEGETSYSYCLDLFHLWVSRRHPLSIVLSQVEETL